MREFSVKQLSADTVELDGKILLNQNGDLLFNDKIIANYEDLITIHVVSNETDFSFLNPKVGDMGKITDTGETFMWNGV